VSNDREEAEAETMDILIVCGAPNPGGPDYALGLVLGLVLNVALWVRHRRLARQPAARQILHIR
jgi:hypothetical protein